MKKYYFFALAGFLMAGAVIAQEVRPTPIEVELNIGVTPVDTEETDPPAQTGGTEDINIGIGELQENGSADTSVQHNESNMEFVTERASDVSVKAVEVRGWDSVKKEEFLGTVKGHAQIKSGQDLENFATGILLRDENIIEVTSDEEGVEVGYVMPAKMFGFIPTGIPVRAKVNLHEEAESRVKVRFPWYRFLFSVPVSAEDVEEVLEPQIDDEVLVSFGHGDNTNDRARLMFMISSTLQAAHDVAMNSIQNIK